MAFAAPVRTVAPSGTFIDMTTIRDHLRVTDAGEDAIVQTYIDAAHAHLDGYQGVLGRCILPQTWTFYARRFEDMDLPLPDAISATVTYLDEAMAAQTYAAANYQISPITTGTRFELLAGAESPAVADRWDAVRIAVQFGMTSVPAALRHAGMLLVGHWYMNREAVSDGAMASVPVAFDALIAPYRFVAI